MNLEQYMKLRKIKDEAASAEIGISRPTVSRIRRGMSRPDWSTLLKLKAWSKGKITPDDYIFFVRQKSKASKRRAEAALSEKTGDAP